MSKIAARDKRTQPIIFIHSAIDDMGLDVYEFRVYAHLARRAGMSGQAWEGVSNMAKICQFSTRKCHSALRSLEGRGLIARKQRTGTTTIYELLDIPDSAPDAGGGLHEVQRGSARGADKGDPNKEITENSEEFSVATPGQTQSAPGKSKEENPSLEPPEQNSSGAQQGTRRAKPRKQNPWNRFIGLAHQAWQEERHKDWPEEEEAFTRRGLGYLGDFWRHYDKDSERAGEMIRKAIAWARDHEDWWREMDTKLTFNSLAAKNKLEDYAAKARHVKKSSDDSQPDRTGEVALLDRHRELIWAVLIGASPDRKNWHSGVVFDPYDPTNREVMYRLEIHPDFFVPKDRLEILKGDGEITWPEGALPGEIAENVMATWQAEADDEDWEDQ